MLRPTESQNVPFQAIPLPAPPVNGLFVELTHVIPSVLFAIQTVPLELRPTATQYEPFQAIPLPIPPENGLVVESFHVIPSVLFVIPVLTPSQYEPFQAIPLEAPAFTMSVHAIPSVLFATSPVKDELYPAASQYEPFQAIPLQSPPENGLFVELVQETPSELFTIQTVAPVEAPTATQYVPFQAIPLATLSGFEVVHESPSVLFAILTVKFELYPAASQYEPFQAIPLPVFPENGLFVEAVQVNAWGTEYFPLNEFILNAPVAGTVLEVPSALYIFFPLKAPIFLETPYASHICERVIAPVGNAIFLLTSLLYFH